MVRLTRPFDFPGADGQKLAGRLDLPATKPLATALFAHCFTCAKDYRAAARIARVLAERGIAVLRFDFTGLGNSGGDFANSNFSTNIRDLMAAAAALGAEIAPPRLLIGHSLGGAAVIKAAAQIPSIGAVATIAAPFDPGHIRWLVEGREAELAATGRALISIAGRPFPITQQFLDDIAAHGMEETLAGLGAPLLVFHDPADTVVPVANAELIMAAAVYPKSFIALPGAGHMVGRQEDAEFVADAIAVHAVRSLGLSQKAEKAARIAGVEQVTVQETGEGNYSNMINADGHLLPADEPVEMGGRDTGPAPYDLLTSALGACTAMTVRMVADRKGWPLQRVAVSLSHEKVDAPAGVTTQNAGNKQDRFVRRITLDGPLSPDQRQKLLEIADKCPVHRSLHSTPVVETSLVDDGAVSSG
jgi:uncharacterized OsmC-like protein/pimeloyl-ACP methyl ester carboxylesterase